MIEEQVSEYVKKALAGKGGAYGAPEVSRMKSAAKGAAEGQRKAAVAAGNQDLLQRGTFRSGLGARMASDAARSAGGAYTNAVAQILNRQAESQEEARRHGAETGLGLAGLQLQREEGAANRRAAGAGRGPRMFTYIDPDTGQSYELPMDLL